MATLVKRGRASPPVSLAALAPFVVAFLGVLVAVGIGALGVRGMRRIAEENARARVELLVDTLVARIEPLTPDGRAEAVRLAVRRSAAEGLLAESDGTILMDATIGGASRADVESWIARGIGETETRVGTGFFVVRPIRGGSFLVLVVRKPPAAEAEAHLVESLVALTTLLVFAAASVAFAVSRDAGRDIDFVTRRIDGMARVRSEPTGELVPVRAIDEIGGLAVAFNRLVVRFLAAERDYHESLGRARAADRDRAAFLAAVSHELRSPLNAILGFSDILAQEVDGPLSAEAREEVEQIRGSGQHLLGLINDILEFSAIESGQLRLAVSAVDVVHVSSDVVRESRLSLAGRPIEIEISGDGPIFAHVDPRRLRQILGNLVSNAVKFTEKGSVRVRVAKALRDVTVEVADTGKGIAEAEQATVFDDYKQAGERLGKSLGAGLGLAIARRLVLAHGGTIRLESELGVGTTFFLTFPLVTKESVPPEKDAAPKAAPTRSTVGPTSRTDDLARAVTGPATVRAPANGGPPSSVRAPATASGRAGEPE